jgi:D-alanyl-D-alanine carboxypeptidase (penicillin-binding protein 5/6)
MRRFALVGFLLSSILAASQAGAAISTTAEHALLMDGDSGQVLWAKDAFVAMPPASMSKLMTLELLFQRLKDGRVKLTDTFPVSERAWRTQGSKSFAALGSRVAVEDLIRGIIIQSGNDFCVVIAEALGGTVEGFVDQMNARAKQIGLAQSHFVNPNGLPEPPGQLMSAMDLARLARHIIHDYPQYYHYFGERSFSWSGISQPNRNLILEKLPGADGLKTGHTDAAGYGVTASAKRGDERLILVLNGLRYPDLAGKAGPAADWFAEQRRAEEAARILDMAFREFRRYALFKPGDTVGRAQVWGGTEATVPLTVRTALAPVLQVDSRNGMKVSIRYDGPLKAPVARDQRVATLVVTAPDHPGFTVPLYAAKAVPETGFFGRMMLGARALLSGKH